MTCEINFKKLLRKIYEPQVIGDFSMALNDTMTQLNSLFAEMTTDLHKMSRGNKSAAQRVRVGTIDLEKIAKRFRKESIFAEKNGKFKKKFAGKKGKRKKKRVL